MTRKRFIKLLMSKGIQRNAAQEIAARYNSRNIPYANAYNDFLISDSVKRSIETMKGIFEKFKTGIQQIKDAFCAFAQDIRNTFEAFEATECIYYNDRDPLPQPQKNLCMKTFVIDRRKAINRIKKKKGTVFPVSFLRHFYSYQTKCLQSVAKCCIIKE